LRADLVQEIADAAQARGLHLCLYHSLNNWYDQPDACDALESSEAYDLFIANTFARLKELTTRFSLMWYDGWWPFNAQKWQAEKMNTMLREIHPPLRFNGRNGLDGDFGTPEGHMSAPTPRRPWEACMTLNDHWGYHRGDTQWKNEKEVIRMLTAASQGQGNLLLKIGPKGDGSIPRRSEEIVQNVGTWLRSHGDAIYDKEAFTFGLMKRGEHQVDWSHNGPFTRKDHSLFHLVLYWPGPDLLIAGLTTQVERVVYLQADGEQLCEFTQDAEKVVVKGLPETAPNTFATVLSLDCKEIPSMELSSGMRIPTFPHPPYDPCPSDISNF